MFSDAQLSEVTVDFSLELQTGRLDYREDGCIEDGKVVIRGNELGFHLTVWIGRNIHVKAVAAL